MSELLGQINDWMDGLFVHGPWLVYLILFAACFVENIVPPFPGDTFMVVAGGLVALGRLDLVPTLAVIILGGMASVLLLYYFGHRHGREFFFKRNFSYFNRHDISKVEALLHKWGVLILLASRFIVGFRSGLAIVTGIAHYSLWRTVVFSLFSYILFSILLLYLGYTLVDNVEKIEQYFERYDAIVWPILVALLLLWIGRRFVFMRGKKS